MPTKDLFYWEGDTTDTPKFIMLVGLPGSGKSTYAKSLGDNYVIHSSDDLREEMFGDVNENSKESNAKLFVELHKRIKADLQNGKNVVYDATNLNSKRRTAFLRELTHIPCHKSCVLVMTPYYVCQKHNTQRQRCVPQDVIKRMYMNFQPPNKIEGWDDIDIIFGCAKGWFGDYKITVLYNPASGISYYDQSNKHHSLTLGDHCRIAADYIKEHYPTNELLYFAALLHDEGKLFTRTTVNAKGVDDGDCHYYQHHCVGAYNSIFYLYNLRFNTDEILHVALLIYLHMNPYMGWKDADENKRDKLRNQFGELYDEVMALHEADEFAH